MLCRVPNRTSCTEDLIEGEIDLIDLDQSELIIVNMLILDDGSLVILLYDNICTHTLIYTHKSIYSVYTHKSLVLLGNSMYTVRTLTKLS